MFIFPGVGRSWSFSPRRWWPACWGAVPLPLPQTAKRAGELAAARPTWWNVSLCVYYNILHFFCPFQNNKPLAILVILNSSPLEAPPYPYPLATCAPARTHTHVETTLKGNGSMFCFAFPPPQVSPKLILWFLCVCLFIFVVVKIKPRTPSWLWL